MSTYRSRRPLAVIVAALLLFLTAACRDDDNTNTSTATTAPGATGTAAPSTGGTSQGITDTEIKIGMSLPTSGPLAVFNVLAKGAKAAFEEVNAAGGIDGRKVTLTVLDDAYDNSRAASNQRQLAENEKVFASFQFGSPALATRDYMEQRKVPQFAFAGNEPLSDVEHYNYTRALWPDARLEYGLVAQHMLKEDPDAKVGILGINTDFTTSVIAGIEAGLGDKKNQLVAIEKYEQTAPDLTGQVNKLKAAGVTALATTVNGPFTKAVEYIRQIGWDVPIYNYSNSTSKLSFLDLIPPAAGIGLRQARWFRDPADAALKEDPGMLEYRDIIAKYGEGANPDDALVINGYGLTQAVIAALQNMGEPTADGLIESWDNLPPTPSPVLPLGVDFKPVKGGRAVSSYEIVEWDGSTWKSLEPVKDAIPEGFIG
jgi:branched-chain amino acid transport system substrate-binding protein